MQKTKTITGKTAFLPACMVGVLIALTITVAGALIGAVCILGEYVEFSSIAIIAIATQFLSVFIGTLFAGKLSKDRKILACALLTCVYFFVLIGIAILLFDGIEGSIGIGLLAGTVACLVGILLNMKEKSRRRSQRRGRRNS